MTAHDLRRAVDVAVETIAANREQHLLLFNPSREIDSLAEHIIALRHHGVPGAVISGLLRDVKRLLALNEDEHGGERTIAGTLDDLARAEHAAERGGGRLAGELSVRALVRALRGDLDTIGYGTGGTEYALAAARVRDICERVPHCKLTSTTLRHELGGRRHDLLVEMCRSVRL